MSNHPYQFPILVFGPSHWKGAGPDEISMEWFKWEKEFGRLEESVIESGDRVGAELCDAAGKRFKITGVTKLRREETTLWERLWTILIGRTWIVRHELERLPDIGFEALREKVAQAILGEPDRWRDDEAVAGEAGEPRDEQEMLDALAARARAARDFPALMQVLYTGHDDGD